MSDYPPGSFRAERLRIDAELKRMAEDARMGGHPDRLAAWYIERWRRNVPRRLDPCRVGPKWRGTRGRRVF